MNERVIVVGGGPAGSATALRLAQHGFPVTLIDRARFPRDKCCSEYGSPGTIAALADLGASDFLTNTTNTRLSGTRVTGARGSRLRGGFGVPGDRHASAGLALPRLELDAALLQLARDAGVNVLESTRCIAVERVAGEMRVTTEQNGVRGAQSARMVVGADGLRSRVARSLGLTGNAFGALRRIAFVAHLDGVVGMGSDAEMHVVPGAYIGLNPLSPTRTNVALVVAAKEVATGVGDPADFVARRLAAFPALQDRVASSRIVRDWLVTGPFDQRCRRSVSDGALLTGDAADFFDPFTGEGIWSALIGAELAANCLSDALRVGGAITARRLAPYRRARRRRFGGKWLVERMIGYAMLRPRFFDRCVARLDRRGLAQTLIGVTGNVLPASRVLNPIFLTRMTV